MMESNEKTLEQNAEQLHKAQAMGDAISHFNMKLGVVRDDTPIEDQMKYLVKYHDVPSVEEMKANENKMDSYRQDFMNTLYDNYFKDYPEMLEQLGDKRTNNNMANFYGLRLMDFLYSSSEKDEDKRKENLIAYFNILPKYRDFLIDYIVNNQRWDLTVNTKESFLAYHDIYTENKALLKKYPNPGTQITLHIKEVRTTLMDKIVHLRELGIDDETYKRVVTDVVIGKYLVLKHILNQMAGGGAEALGIYANVIFRDYPLKEVYISSCEVQDKFVLDDEQKKQMSDVKKMLEFLYEKNIGTPSSSGSGCMVTLLLFLIPVSLLICLL